MRRWFRIGIPVLAGALCTGCSSGPDLADLDRIPGTEQVIPAGDCLTVSPDERHLVFIEELTNDPVTAVPLTILAYRYRPVSIDLATGVRTLHVCPPGQEWDEPHPPAIPNRAEATRFKPHAWQDGRFFGLNRTDRRNRGLVLDPGEPDLSVEKLAELRHMRSSDQMSPARLNRWLYRLEEKWGRHVPYHRNSDNKDLAMAGEAPAEVFYFYDEDRVFRASAEGNSVLAEHPDKRSASMIIAKLRVSPDQRFLAYSLWERKTFFMFIGGATRLMVLDLKTGHRRVIVNAHGIDGMVWSRDGETLYVSARDEGISGIFRVRLADYFDVD